MLHKPTRKEVRTGAGGLAFFSGSALLILLTTEPPAGKYYPWWSFALAALGVVAGLAVLVATFLGPSPEERVDEQLRRIGDSLEELLRTRPFVTGWQIASGTNASPETIERAVRGLQAEGKITVQGQVIRGRTMVVTPEFPEGLVTQEQPPIFERTTHSKTTDEGTVTAWEETRRGQDATVTPKTVEAVAQVPTPSVRATEEKSTPPAGKDDDPQVLRRTPEELWDVFTHLSGIQAGVVLEKYRGDLMQVSGEVFSVASSSSDSAMVTFRRPGDRLVYMMFRGEGVRDRLYDVRKGDQLTVRGRIDRVVTQSMDLEDCEVVDG